MKTSISIVVFLLLANALIYAQEKIVLSAENILNTSTRGDATFLVDEQELVGDPMSGTPGTPGNAWAPQYTDWHYPVSIVIDLKGYYALSNIYLYDTNGSGNIEFSGGTPFAWESLFTYNQASYNQWKGFDVDIVTRYVQVTIYAENVTPVEIVLYGVLNNEVTEDFTVLPHEKPLMKDFIGLNGFIDDPIDLLAVGGFLREYHDWGFTELSENSLEFFHSKNYWDFDKYYTDLKNAGVTVCPCLQKTVSFHSSPAGRLKPLEGDEDSLDPTSYAEHAQFLFQYAARYGSVAVDHSQLLLNSNQVKKSGLNLLKYYENWNEQDAWWKAKNGYFTPYEYAAMSSADMDGHMGTMGPGYGLKTADPNAKLVMSGLAIIDLNYIRAMMFWAKFNRNGSFPVDVLNFHHYSNDVGGQGNSSKGVSPESDNLKERIKELVDFRDKYLHGIEVWVTEFGYDTHPNSVQRATSYGSYTQKQVQAMWLIRSYLAIAAAGAEKAAMYMSRDVNVLDPTKYSNSGLTGPKNDWTKKDSWYYVSTLHKQLGNFRFHSEVASGNTNVLIYKFVEDGTNNAAYVVWCPTSNSTKVNGYNLAFNEQHSRADVIDFVNGDDDGAIIKTSTNVWSIALNVSERPLIVKTLRGDVPDAQTYTLTKGWNIISFNKELTDMTVESVFSPILDKVEIIKNFDDFYSSDLDKDLNSLKEINLGEGYFIKLSDNASFQYSGNNPTTPKTSSTLTAGWNLIGIPLSDDTAIEQALSSIWQYIEQVKSVDEYYMKNSSINTLSILKPRIGYVVKVSADCTIVW